MKYDILIGLKKAGFDLAKGAAIVSVGYVVGANVGDIATWIAAHAGPAGPSIALILAPIVQSGARFLLNYLKNKDI